MSKQFNALATELVGDGKHPNLYFVTNANGECVTVTSSGKDAYRQWKRLASVRPLAECALEDRQTGTICSVEPESDEPGSKLRVWDDSAQYLKGG